MPPLLEAESISLQAALMPLLARVVVVRSLVAEGAAVHLILSGDGLDLPDLGAGAAAAPREPSGDAPPSVAIQEVEVRDAKLYFENRTLSPPFSFELTHIDARAAGDALDEPFHVSLAVKGIGGGAVEATGTATLDGDLDVELELDAFPLQPLDPYLARASELGGTVTGKISFRGSVVAPDPLPDPLVADLVLQDGTIRFEDFSAHGRMNLHAELRGSFREPDGRFEIDATAATLSFAEVYRKEPGRPAHVTGRFVAAPDGSLAVDDVKLTIENVEAQGRVRLGERTEVVMRVEPVELADWHLLLRALDFAEANGRVGLPELRILTNPLQLWGESRIDAVSLRLPRGRVIGLRGTIRAEGDAIRSEGLVLELADQPVAVEGVLAQLDGPWDVQLRVQTQQAETNDLLVAFGGPDDTLYGPLALDAALEGSLRGESGFMESLHGRGGFTIRPGRLRGVSILEATFRRFDHLGAMRMLRTVSVPGLQKPVAPGLNRHYGEGFDVMSATLDITAGTARTQDFRLVTPSYEFTMRGLIRLADLGLDAKGELILGEEAALSLAGAVGVKKLPVLQGLVIPIPRIGGTLTDPKPEPDFSVLARALTGNVPAVQGVERLLRGAGGLLGP
jgi:hypothetical protein